MSCKREKGSVKEGIKKRSFVSQKAKACKLE